MFARVLLALALLAAIAALADVPVPPLRQRVTDLTGTLTSAQVSALEAKLAAFEQRKGSQIFVLIVPSTQPETIEEYAIKVADAWKPGRKGVDDGVLLLVAKDDRALRIDTRYGLEGVIPDAVAKRIVSDIIVPRFRSGDFGGGIDAGVDAMIKLIDGEPLPPPSQWHGQPQQERGVSLQALLAIGFVLIFVVGGVLRAMLGRLPAAGVIGALAGAHRLVHGGIAAGCGGWRHHRVRADAVGRRARRRAARALAAGAAEAGGAAVSGGAVASVAAGAGWAAAVVLRAGGSRCDPDGY